MMLVKSGFVLIPLVFEVKEEEDKHDDDDGVSNWLIFEIETTKKKRDPFW